MAASDGLAAQALAFAHDELITIQLEGCDQNLTVSKALLCSASDYFKKALNGSFTESSTRTLKVPGCDLATFQLFLYYMTNCRKLQDEDHSVDKILGLNFRPGDEAEARNAQIRLCRLWIFADAYLMPELQNAAMDVLIDSFRDGDVNLDAVVFAFEHTAEESLLRDMFVAEARKQISHQKWEKEQVDRLGIVPGFFNMFVRSVMNCGYGDKLDCSCSHYSSCYPSNREPCNRATDWHVDVDVKPAKTPRKAIPRKKAKRAKREASSDEDGMV